MLARDVAPHGVTVNNLLPGQFDTDRLRSNHERFAQRTGVEPDEFRKRSKSRIPAGRFGSAVGPVQIYIRSTQLLRRPSGMLTASGVH